MDAFAPPTRAEGRELNKCIVCCLQCFKCFKSCGAFFISLPMGALVAIITIPVSAGLVVAGWHSVFSVILLLVQLDDDSEDGGAENDPMAHFIAYLYLMLLTIDLFVGTYASRLTPNGSRGGGGRGAPHQ